MTADESVEPRQPLPYPGTYKQSFAARRDLIDMSERDGEFKPELDGRVSPVLALAGELEDPDTVRDAIRTASDNYSRSLGLPKHGSG